MVFVAIVLWFQWPCATAYGQMVIHGKVIDRLTREPLELAVVTDVRTLKNTLTDKDGQFVLKNVSGNDSLFVSFIGYTAKKIKVELSRAGLIIPLGAPFFAKLKFAVFF